MVQSFQVFHTIRVDLNQLNDWKLEAKTEPPITWRRICIQVRQ